MGGAVISPVVGAAVRPVVPAPVAGRRPVRRSRIVLPVVLVSVFVFVVGSTAACPRVRQTVPADAGVLIVDDGEVAEGEGESPAEGEGEGAGEGEGEDCVLVPVTHDELINACTTAVGVEKSPSLPLLNPDGSLPPLP
jgi:hypothetical protein